MSQQKLYTEEQVRKAIAIGYDWCHVKYMPSDDMIDSFIESLNPVNIPSDEEIEHESGVTWSLLTYQDTFKRGAKWMRDKILNK